MIKIIAICLWNYHNKTHCPVYYFGQLMYAKTKLMEVLQRLLKWYAHNNYSSKVYISIVT